MTGDEVRTPLPYFGGIPTAPDVNRLLDQIEAAPGLVAYSTIESVTNIPRSASRFRTVVAAWRAHLRRDLNLETAAVPNEGIRILTEVERIPNAASKHGRGARQVRRSAVAASMIRTETLEETERIKADHLRRLTAASAVAVSENAKALTHAFQAQAQLPRIVRGGRNSGA